jgi:hypothetical protein
MAKKSWWENWWAGVDPNDGSWREPPNSKPLSDREHADARRWADGQRATGGAIRRMLG